MVYLQSVSVYDLLDDSIVRKSNLHSFIGVFARRRGKDGEMGKGEKGEGEGGGTGRGGRGRDGVCPLVSC